MKKVKATARVLDKAIAAERKNARKEKAQRRAMFNN